MSDGINLSDILLIRENDRGIRPAGKPDECFYCKMKVGNYHSIDCVVLTKKNKYSILVEGEYIGTLIWDDPISWDIKQCESHKNDSSWCVDNALEFVNFLDTEKEKSLKIKWNEYSLDNSCGCFFITIRCDEPMKKDNE